MTRGVATGFGLVAIGSEVLDGRVRDRHFTHAQQALLSRGFELVYALVLPDVPRVIESQLRWAFAEPEPFFCCGGIGATPDDHTRDCVARVLGVPIERHAEGARLLEARFGAGLNEARMRMVDFPCGAHLIPNPVNQVPGFRVGNGYFLPGFPSMAQPMMDWVLDTLYEAPARQVARALRLPGAREGDLVELMERFIRRYPGLRFSSLPRFVDGGTEVELGLRGPEPAVVAALAVLAGLLTEAGVRWLDAAEPV